MVDIDTPRTASDFDAVRKLCWEYRDHLLGMGARDAEMIAQFYPEDSYARLMEDLETVHAPPAGAIKLARHAGAVVGCGMSHAFSPGTAEIKRVFVRDTARRLGAGRALMTALIAQCRTDGFSRILLDTAKPLEAAQRLYLSLGFRLRAPYHEVPEGTLDRLLFFEMRL